VSIPPRICDLGTMSAQAAGAAAARIASLGFSHLLTHLCSRDALRAVAAQSGDLGLVCAMDLTIWNLDDPAVQRHPDWFAVRRAGAQGGIVDPRWPDQPRGCALVRFYEDPQGITLWWHDLMAARLEDGACGFLFLRPQKLPHDVWRQLIASAKSMAAKAIFIADTVGLSRGELAGLRECGFDHCLSSLPWWDMRASWLVEEYEAARAVAPPLGLAGTEDHLPPASHERRRARLALAALTGVGLVTPFALLDGSEDDVRGINALVAGEEILTACGPLRSLTGPGASVTVLVRSAAADQALLALVNPGDGAVPAPTAFDDWELESAQLLSGERGERLVPGEVRLLRVKRRRAIRAALPSMLQDVNAAAARPRIVIGDVSPGLDDGLAVKREVGDTLAVEADIFTDGHPLLAAELMHRAADEAQWRHMPMTALGNDRWAAHLPLERVGRHFFAIDAWIDNYGGFARDLTKKRDAGQAIALDLAEGLAAIQAAAQDDGALHAPFRAVVETFPTLSESDRAALLLAPETLEAMRRVQRRTFTARSTTFAVDADRPAARFASWYELFPRSQSDDAARHGTFADVVARLPAIRAMGFDTLYLPPIHPVGTANRKGRNNALQAAPGDPGSVYAIGSAEGGHDAIHPELGSLEDFRNLIAAAAAQGLEIALDFAVQCSPDHPWLRQHPGWFDWRADGSVKHAENPPKVYEDIVNVDFYGRDAVPGLWLALRDIVLFWAGQGVRIFRVDNPHTKPFAFWRWLIENVRAENPDILFLAEAFTRPKVMYHLARLGFSQSYTYFTWRNSKSELTDYMRELGAPPVSEFFRPHFFANTPDINPYYLQQSGRAGFLIRAALAATLSGLWGIASGFELCEAAALPGREEYLDSEKYAVKPRDWNAPGNIIAEIAQLNAIRRAEPALQTHLGLTFYNAFNPNILYYGKRASGDEGMILIAVSLNPHQAEGADFEIPLWEWGLPDHGALAVRDLLNGARFSWQGKIQHLHLTPQEPYRIWRVAPAREA
jgi:starch synthase (maltosyl-transferring)